MLLRGRCHICATDTSYECSTSTRRDEYVGGSVNDTGALEEELDGSDNFIYMVINPTSPQSTKAALEQVADN